MRRVTGIGGIFFKSEDPDKLYQWHETQLGIPPSLRHGRSLRVA